MWYLRLRDFFEQRNCQKSKFDSCLFTQRDNSGISRALVIHVDDICYVANDSFVSSVITPLKTEFSVSAEAELPFRYLGLDQARGENGSLIVDQGHYVSKVEEVDLSEDKVGEEAACLQEILGKLLWVATQSQPDISYDVIYLSICVKTPSKTELRTSNKVLSRLHHTTVSRLAFPDFKITKNCVTLSFFDASLNNLVDRGTQTGFLVLLVDLKTQKLSIMNWKSYRLKREVRSTLAAEMMASADALDSAF